MSQGFKSVVREQVIHGVLKDLHVSEPTIYANNEARHRSGHMSHAMVELSPGRIIDFNSNCSAERYFGHTPFGWIEYRYSEDGGEQFGEIHELPYAKRVFDDGIMAISVEKAVLCDDGTLIAFCLRNAACLEQHFCEPWAEPMYVRSTDGGRTWTKEAQLCPYPGRMYGAINKDGTVYVLHFCNERFRGRDPEHLYRLFKSTDNGISFYEESVVDFGDTFGLGYGSLIFMPDHRLVAYAQDLSDPEHLRYSVSDDEGKTWSECGKSRVACGAINPQINILDGQYIMHCRSAFDCDLVLYTSADGLHWDEGHILNPEKHSTGCFYSNNVIVHGYGKDGGDRMIVQFSESYDSSRVNAMHIMIESC